MNGAAGYLLVFSTRLVADLPLLAMFLFLHFCPEGQGREGAAVFNLALFLLFALSHSLLTREPGQRLLARLVGEEGTRALFIWISGISLTLVLLFWRPLSGALWSTAGPPYWALVIIYAALVAGMIYTGSQVDYLAFLGMRDLLRRLRGKPARPAVFQLRGPYAHVRHPLYLLLLLAMWTAPVMTYTRLEFSVLGTLYMMLGTFHEERNLRRELGEVYAIYQANVPMWIPRLRPWRPAGSGEALDSAGGR